MKENQDVDSIPKILQTDIIRTATERRIAYKILRVKQIKCLTRSYGKKLIWTVSMEEELCSTVCEEMLMHEDETLFKY